MANIGDGNASAGYPAAIATQSPQEQDGVTIADAAVPNDLALEIIATQTELGANPAGDATTVKTFIQQGHNTYGAHELTYTTTAAATYAVVANTDEIINVTAACTVTLPNPTTNQGRVFIIQNATTGNLRVTVDTSGSLNIGGQSDRRLDSTGDSMTVYSNGATYDILCYVGTVY